MKREPLTSTVRPRIAGSSASTSAKCSAPAPKAATAYALASPSPSSCVTPRERRLHLALRRAQAQLARQLLEHITTADHAALQAEIDHPLRAHPATKVHGMIVVGVHHGHAFGPERVIDGGVFRRDFVDAAHE